VRRKNKQEKESNPERWLISYADFITLLFAVFVTLYAISQVDRQKVAEVAVSVRDSFGYDRQRAGSVVPSLVETIDLRPPPPVVVSQPLPVAPEALAPGVMAEAEQFASLKDGITSLLVTRAEQDKVKVSTDSRGLVVSLKEAGFFASGSATIRPDALPLLEEVAKALADSATPVRIEGHTDNVPVHSKNFPSNWELSTARATTMVHYLVDNLHFKPGRLAAVGYGEFRPIADNGDEAGRAKNRRVDLVLLSSEGQKGEPLQGFRQED
jgi:chemotaxis protein MotB